MTHILRQQPSQASASRCFRIHVHSYHILIIVSRISPLITHPNSWILRWKASTCSPQAPQTLLPTDGQKHKIRPPNCHINCSLGANGTAHYNIKLEPLEGLLKTFPNNLQQVQANLNANTVVNRAIAPPEAGPVVNSPLDRRNAAISTNLSSSFLVCGSTAGKYENLDTLITLRRKAQ